MRLTAEDVLDIEVPDHLLGYELEDGELVEVGMLSAEHGRLCAELVWHLRNHIDTDGPAGVVYTHGGCVLETLRRDPERLREPDVSYASDGTLAAKGGHPKKGWLRVIPDLVVEVDSPNRKPVLEHRRIQDYLDAGVRLLWIIHAEAESATIYWADGSARFVRASEDLLGDPVLPGFRLPLSRLSR